MTAKPSPMQFATGPRTRLLGEVITWTCPGLSVGHSMLVEALLSSGLDPGVASELAPRHAFARACRKFSDRRIIRLVAEDATTLTFQFTAESRAGDRYEYVMETLLQARKADRFGHLRPARSGGPGPGRT